ncbi:2-oxoisovalerate dehydrogenase E2 component [Steroidobacter denitrificans]|uniref:Dihydrolipoamide acetyltransferase component of pyruvate dehydrogenase complex n=1 Tax=Steroidobacter denitrificans TaxID=465721 RepID=A0A127F8C7_STEDE|nr:dihydrolipoamide acetyltransferase family protein [Steroidobacter denitrificans]AMN45891.1 2-oxoisovalerate dehydrogenase E2 component [Steroidobacter denitrificans]
MTRHVVKLPDLGEGTVSSEIVLWRVKPGDVIQEDQPMVEMSTDKAVMEMPAPVSGRVVSLGGQPGDAIAVGAELLVIETDSPIPSSASPRSGPAADPPQSEPLERSTAIPASSRIMTSPATRLRARKAGIDLTTITGTGRDGRILREDLDAALSEHSSGTQEHRSPRRGDTVRRTATEEIRILGVRRIGAQRVSESKRNIPHFAYVEEVDVTELERLRQHLNTRLSGDAVHYTYLPLLALALARTLEHFPKCNALYDAERSVLVQHSGIHLGIATQTPDGLKVPVVRHVEAMTLREVAAEIRRVTEAARHGTAGRDELRGSTITITSLGRLGGIVSTPIINAPEIAIIGINKSVERPVVHNGNIAVRLMMNLSSSFDHRFIDGYDAAEAIQTLKTYLEQPAMIFIRD